MADALLSALRTPRGVWSYSKKAKTTAEKLVKWLKANQQHADYELVLRALISYHPDMWKTLCTESIALLPPQARSPIVHYDSEFIEYMHAYTANPQRPPTHEEIVNILEYELSYTSYPTQVFPVLNAAGFTPDHLSPNKTLNGIPFVEHIRQYIAGAGAECGRKCVEHMDAAGQTSVFCPMHGRFVKMA